MRKKLKHGSKIRSFAELARELGTGKDIVVSGKLRKNAVLKNLVKWDFFTKFIQAGAVFRPERKRA